MRGAGITVTCQSHTIERDYLHNTRGLGLARSGSFAVPAVARSVARLITYVAES